MSEQLTQVGDVITVFFSILIGAFYFGQSGPNLQKLAEAQGAATPIYGIIDRVGLVTAQRQNDGGQVIVSVAKVASQVKIKT